MPLPYYVYAFSATAFLVLFTRQLVLSSALLIVTLGLAFVEHRVTPVGLFFVGVMAATGYVGSRHAMSATGKRVVNCIVGLLGLLLALHVLPGFDNLSLVKNVQISPAGTLFTQYLNLDKGVAGLLMLIFFCRPARPISLDEFQNPKIWLVVGMTLVSVLGLAMLLGVTTWEPKWTSYTPTFLVVNLFFTCIAEEAFFRGGIQQGLDKLFPNHAWLVVGASALLFGASHVAGGILVALLATLAGLGYALIYQTTKRIGSAILLHFSLNALHFVFFVYPAIAK